MASQILGIDITIHLNRLPDMITLGLYIWGHETKKIQRASRGLMNFSSFLFSKVDRLRDNLDCGVDCFLK
jgi:hypothetical protein